MYLLKKKQEVRIFITVLTRVIKDKILVGMLTALRKYKTDCNNAKIEK